MILVDDNIRDIGGHYYELAALLLTGAEQLGFQPVLATHASFENPQAVPASWSLRPTFNTRRLVRWSLGVDGDSRFQRDLSGKTVGGSGHQNLWAAVTDQLSPPAKRPQPMLRQWATDLTRLLEEIKPSPADTLLVNTGDDFAMLALAAALEQADVGPLRIDVIFHFALYEADQTDRNERLHQLGRQLRSAVEALRPHHVHIHATTEALAAQMRETDCGIHINSIPYPTRPRNVVSGATSQPLKAVLAGLPRAEKGREAIADLLSGVDETLLRNGHFQMSMQMPSRGWQAMVPKSLHANYERSLSGDAGGPLEIMTSNLSTEAYHAWLDTADLGLFLYDPNRYVARCSGVLLEMFARGVPVIVPDRCWLADQLRLAGGHRSIGFIYQDRSEIPDLMRQFAKRRCEIQSRSIKYAATIAKRHGGRNTLLQMGIKPADLKQQAA
jgi:hypothetical protein